MRKPIRWGRICIAVPLLSAWGALGTLHPAAAVASAASAVRGTLTGRVTVGPVCPVEGDPLDPVCRPLGIRATVRIRRGSQNVGTTVVTDSHGRYRVRLRAGTFTVRATSPSARFCGPVTVTVRNSGTTRADITCDSGIR